MFRCLSTALLVAAATTLLAPDARASVKSGASFHPTIAPNIHPIRHPGSPISVGRGSHLGAGTHGKSERRFHRFSHHHHNKRLLGWGLPLGIDAVGNYGAYYDPAYEPRDADPALPSDYGTFTGSPRRGVFYRTGCQSEEVSVPSAHGPTRVTVTRCAIPSPELQPLK
ncbi:MAG TPA: hypothetical protein VN917_10700 [Xanthobacteraceae bacterium]|nr:hypothetical protein [Xanthobacteraceae bacterium]